MKNAVNKKCSECYYLQLLFTHFFYKLIRERDIRYNSFSHIFQNGGWSALWIVPPTWICTLLYSPLLPSNGGKKTSIYGNLECLFRLDYLANHIHSLLFCETGCLFHQQLTLGNVHLISRSTKLLSSNIDSICTCTTCSIFESTCRN